MLLKEADWPVLRINIPDASWRGVLREPICLADDIDTSTELRINALAHQMGIEIRPPIDRAFWSFAFRNVPGLWPLGWGPAGPLKAKKPRGRPKTSPDDIASAVEELRTRGWTKMEAIWEELSSRPEFKGMSPAGVEAAYYRDLGKPSPATAIKIARAFSFEDDIGQGLCSTPDDELTRTCLQNWSDWMAVLVLAWPEQQDILLRHRSFWHRPVILSRYIFALRNSD